MYGPKWPFLRGLTGCQRTPGFWGRHMGSLFDTMDTSTLCNLTISRIYSLQNSSSVKVICTARKCADLVSRSTMTHTASCLRDVRGK